MNDAAKVEAVDSTADFEHLFPCLNSIEKIIHTGWSKNDLIRYIPKITKPAHQRQLQGTLKKKAYADDTYKRYRITEFNVKLTNNHVVNFHNVYLIFQMKIKKNTNNATNLETTV